MASASQNILLYYTHPSCDNVQWQNPYVVSWSEMNNVDVVMYC